MLYAQVGQRHLARTSTETSPELNPGTLSCLSARPYDLADLTVAQPEVACVPLSGLSFLYSKRAAAARSSVRIIDDHSFCPGFDPTSRGTTPVAVCTSRACIQLEIRQQALKKSVPSLSLLVLCRLCSLHRQDLTRWSTWML